MSEPIFPEGLLDRVGGLLANPEILKLLTGLLPALLSGGGAPPAGEGETPPVLAVPPAETTETEGENEQAPAPADEGETDVPAALPDLSALAGLLPLLGGGGTGSPSPAASQEKESSLKSRQNAALLAALRPYLSPARREKLDRISHLTSLLEVMGTLGVLDHGAVRRGEEV